MPPYSIRLKASVEKDLRRLARDVLRRVLKRIDELGEDPFPRQAVRLSGAERLFRVRVGDYRIIYEVDTKTRVVTVQYVRHRAVAYGHL